MTKTFQGCVSQMGSRQRPNSISYQRRSVRTTWRKWKNSMENRLLTRLTLIQIEKCTYLMRNWSLIARGNCFCIGAGRKPWNSNISTTPRIALLQFSVASWFTRRSLPTLASFGWCCQCLWLPYNSWAETTWIRILSQHPKKFISWKTGNRSRFLISLEGRPPIQYRLWSYPLRRN